MTKWKGREKEYHKEYMREYRARKKIQAIKEETQAFVKAFGPFEGRFSAIKKKIETSNNPLQTIMNLMKKNEKRITDLHEEYSKLEVHAHLFDKNHLEYKEDWLKAQKILTQMEFLRVEIDALKLVLVYDGKLKLMEKVKVHV